MERTYEKEVSQVVSELNTDLKNGLSSKEAQARLEKYHMY